MPAPLVLPPLPPPRLELPPHQRSRLGVWFSFIAHLVIILVVLELTRNANFWDESARARTALGGRVGGGGGQAVSVVHLPSPPPAPPAARTPAPRVTPPPEVPKTIAKPEPAPIIPPAADTTPHPPAATQTTLGSGGGSGGGAGPGTGPGSGPGTGPGSSPAGAAGTGDSAKRGTPPEPRQLIVPPFDYPKSMRGVEVDVNFFVRADGRVERVVFIPEIPDRAYARKLEDVMRAYRFRPARSPEGLPVPGNTVVRITF